MSKELELFQQIVKGYTEMFNISINRPKDTIVKWKGVEEIENSLKALEIIKENKIQGLFIKWDGDFWTIEVKGFPYPIAYGRKKEEYDLLKEVLL